MFGKNRQLMIVFFYAFTNLLQKAITNKTIWMRRQERKKLFIKDAVIECSKTVMRCLVGLFLSS